MTCIRLVVTAAFLLVTVLSTLICTAGQAETGVALTAEEQQWLQRHPIIKLAPDPDFKPIEFFDENGQYQGASADMIRLLERKLGITITVVHLSNWDEVLEKFKAHQVDLLGAMVRTPNREKFALFTDTLVAVPGGIFARSGSRTNLTLADLKGKKVAVVSNYASHDILRTRFPDIRLEVVPDVSTALAKTSLGMVDFYVENMANATFYAQQAGITNLQLAGKTDFDYRWGIGIRKDWPELQGILNKGLAAIGKEERSGALQKWLYVDDLHWAPSRTFVIGVVAALLALLLAAAAWANYALKKVVRSRTASLQEELGERKKAEEALKALSVELEDRVRSRTADLEREIAERTRSEQAVAASELRFRQLFQNVADPVYIADQTGKILAANDQASLEHGFSHEQLLAMNVGDLDAVNCDADKVADQIKAFPASAPVTFETVHRRSDGTTFPAEVKVRRIEFDNRPAVIGVARNISERKKAEEERIRLEQQLLHAQKLESLGVLAGGIAHDFNNILTSIIGNAELAHLRLGPSSPALENLQRIEASAVRAADLARQMLAYSGKGRFVIESIDLNRLLQEMGHMLHVAISKKVVLQYHLAEQLPAIEVDATQIRQIVMNLVINASEAIGDHDGVIAVSTGCLECREEYLKDAWLIDPIPEGSYVSLEVSDTGCGMDKETLARIFDPFFTTKFTGRGLGMAAVLGIIRSHKGAIKVYSEPGKGTCFKVLLPAAAGEPSEGVVEAEPVLWRGEGVVLLVDDEESIRSTGSELLRELGFEVITAADGCEALEIYRNHPAIALVLLDLTMPHMDGEQCFRELRQVDPAVRVIMSSGFSEHEVSQKFAGKGLAGLIQKPYKLSSLREVLRAASPGEGPA
ncbi:response regulator [Geomonas diazotrophica]|uniref:response regulator n=1 Tax=Geomonas diazotrophica TaxID=2843197 RepID=UPI001F1A0A60|nr:transporter substrate-binding domain-containing protein [Geomonas diazotrophica]